MEINKVYPIDCMAGFKEISSKSIDCVFTDPPYGINKKGVKNDENLDEYYKALPEIYRVLKDNTFFITFASIGNLPLFFHKKPFKFRWQYIIYINNGMVRGSIGFNRYISVLIFQKGEARIKKPMLDIFECSTSSKQCRKRTHPTEKRLDAIKKIIPTFTKEEDIVLDPFAGTGNILVGSRELGRYVLGFEIDKDYCRIANKKVIGVSPIPPPSKDRGMVSLEGFYNKHTLKQKKKSKKKRGKK